MLFLELNWCENTFCPFKKASNSVTRPLLSTATGRFSVYQLRTTSMYPHVTILIRVLLVCSRYVTCMLLVRIRVVRMYPHVTRICYPYVPAWCFSQDIWLAKKNLWIIFSNLSLYGIDLSGQSLQIVWHILKENSS